MEKIKYIIIGIMALSMIGIYIWYISENKKLTNEVISLNSQITALEAHQDTIYVPGKKDTVFVKRWLKIPLIELKNKEIDTTLEVLEHSITIKTDSDKIDIGLTCLIPEVIISEKDTVKVPYMVEVAIPPKVEPFYNKKEAWFGYGVAVTAILIKLLNK